MNKKIYLIPILIALFSSIAAFAAKPSFVGIYSSFHYSEKSGDIVGMEIQIIPNPIGYSAIVQASEGAPAFPEVYRINIKENSFKLDIPKTSACGLMPGEYSGSFKDNALVLSGPTPPGRKYILAKGKSFWE